MKTLKLKTLGSCLAATVMSGALAFSAFAADISFDWFQENATTAAAALANEGATDWGTWACQDGLSTVMTVAGQDVVLDVDEEAPLSFEMKASSSATQSPIISGTFTFGRAYDVNALPAVTGAKIGLCLANDAGTLKLAYIDDGDWQYTEGEPAYYIEKADDPISVSISVSGTKVTYALAETGDTIGEGQISSDASLSSAEFVGAGSFQAFDGEYTAEKAAKIGDTYYDTLELAAAAVQNGDVVTVLDDEKTWPAPGKRIGYTFGAGTVEEPGYIPALDATALNAVGLKGSIDSSTGAFTAAPNFANGTGDQDSPFEIATAADLTTLKNLVANGFLTDDEQCFKQTANIALTGVWPGIGIAGGKDYVNGNTANVAVFKAGAFKGVYDGNDCSITGVKLATTDYAGLFNSTYGAVIKNLSVGVVDGGFEAGTATCGGVVAGVAWKTEFNTVTTLAGSVTAVKGVGGISGYTMLGCVFIDCVNNLNITSSSNNKAGGIACITQDSTGEENDPVLFDGCVNNGAITCSTAAGGIVGYNELPVEFDNATVINAALTTLGTGSVIGNLVSGTVTVDGTITAPAGIKSVNKAVNGLNFATVEDDTATFIADDDVAAGNTYKVMSGIATFDGGELAKDAYVSFNRALNTGFTASFDPAEGCKIVDSTEGTVITYTCVADKTEVSVEALPENVEELVIKQGGDVVEPEQGGLVWKLDPNSKYTITFVAVDGYYAEPETTAEMDVEYKVWTAEQLAALTTIKAYEAEVGGTYYKTIAAAVDAAKGAEITVLVDAAWGALAIDADSTLTVVDGNITIVGSVTLVDNYTVEAGKFLGITNDGSFNYADYKITLGEGSSFICNDDTLKEFDAFTNENVKDPVEIEEGVFEACYKYELESAAPGPEPTDPDDGTVTKDDDGKWVVTPAKDKTSISIKGAGGLDFKVTDSRDFTITFDAAPASVKVMNNGVDISALVKGMAEGGNTFSTELDPAKATPAIDTEAETPFAVGDTVSLAVAAEAGLCYRLVRAGDLGFAESTAVAVETPTEKTTISLADEDPDAAAPFYKVIVTKEIIVIE